MTRDDMLLSLVIVLTVALAVVLTPVLASAPQSPISALALPVNQTCIYAPVVMGGAK
jgi:hypothetical protein